MRFVLLLAAVVLAAPSCPLLAQTALDVPALANSWQALDKGIHESSPLKRAAAIAHAGVLRPQPRPVAMLEPLLEDKDPGVRQTACSVLGEMKSKASIPKLKAVLSDKAPEVVFAAAKALYALEDPAGRAVLEEILAGEQKDSSGFLSSSIHDAHLKIYDPKSLVMIGVNQASGLLGPFGAAVPLAEQLLKDGQASGKTVAALMLATDKSPDSKPALHSALADKNWTVRVAALRAVALRDLTEYFDAVASMVTDDKREEVRYAAAAAAIRLKQVPETAKPAQRKRLPAKAAKQQ